MASLFDRSLTYAAALDYFTSVPLYNQFLGFSCPALLSASIIYPWLLLLVDYAM